MVMVLLAHKSDGHAHIVKKHYLFHSQREIDRAKSSFPAMALES